MTADDFHTSIHAKVQGTWNLHNASLELLKQPLDFFTMLSSILGVVGREGQANYAAANTFLDAFASYRQSKGLRANAVDLGMMWMSDTLLRTKAWKLDSTRLAGFLSMRACSAES
jgi:NAD(P)-dependent dehydrogenase (short-subunit alcohol dehydrogenase family)